jgi:hypothetical protein
MEKTYQVFTLSGETIGQYCEPDFIAKIRTGEISLTDFYLTEGMTSPGLVDDFVRENRLFN